MTKGMKVLSGFGIALGIAVLAFLIWKRAFVSFIDNYELGFVYDRFAGKITKLETTGWVIKNPIRYDVHAIDGRPYQVSISANSRILNAKLVRFNPEGLETFVEWHGRNAGDSTYSLLEILKCYAFDRDDGKDCPFITVVSVLEPSQTGPAAKVEATKK